MLCRSKAFRRCNPYSSPQERFRAAGRRTPSKTSTCPRLRAASVHLTAWRAGSRPKETPSRLNLGRSTCYPSVSSSKPSMLTDNGRVPFVLGACAMSVSLSRLPPREPTLDVRKFLSNSFIVSFLCCRVFLLNESAAGLWGESSTARAGEPLLQIVLQSGE